ncbi:MAG: hypothetical protein J0L93_05025 [Deltaproteobacteria bacterium]|nr:hypothetical protein [Deltaproteobacteria bacterium]
MKSKSFIWFAIILFSLTCLGTWAYENLSPFEKDQEWMDLEHAEKLWGKDLFSIEKFRTATTEERAKMSVSLIKSKNYIGKTIQEIKSELGPYTGYFFSDRIPAYQICEGWKKNKNTWNIVFLPGLNGKIKDVRIHKNCCPDEIWIKKGISPPKE